MKASSGAPDVAKLRSSLTSSQWRFLERQALTWVKIPGTTASFAREKLLLARHKDAQIYAFLKRLHANENSRAVQYVVEINENDDDLDTIPIRDLRHAEIVPQLQEVFPRVGVDAESLNSLDTIVFTWYIMRGHTKKWPAKLSLCFLRRLANGLSRLSKGKERDSRGEASSLLGNGGMSPQLRQTTKVLSKGADENDELNMLMHHYEESLEDTTQELVINTGTRPMHLQKGATSIAAIDETRKRYQKELELYEKDGSAILLAVVREIGARIGRKG